MPRLPGPSSIDVRPRESQRPLATIDNDAAQLGMASFGESIRKAGNELYRVADHQNDLRDADEDSRARSIFLQRKADLDAQFEADEDHKTWQPRYAAGLTKARDEAAGLITDPRRRERFVVGTVDPVIAGAQGRMFERFNNKRKDIARGEADEEDEKLLDAGLRTSDEAERYTILRTLRDRQDVRARGGIYTYEQAGARKRRLAERYADGSLMQLPPVERRAALGGAPKAVSERVSQAMQFFVERGWAPHQAAGIVGNLYEESRRLDPTAINPRDGRDGSDSIGLGQWNAGRAIALKRFAKDRGLDWRSFNVQLDFVDHELRGSESKAGAMIRGATNAREAAEGMIMYERPAGSQSGVRNAHNYRGRVARAEEFAGGPVTPHPRARMAEFLSPERRQRMLEQTDVEIARNDRAGRLELESLIKDDTASIERTGQPVGALTRERVEGVFGPEYADAWERDRARSQKFYDTVSRFGDMTPEQIMEAVEKARPQPGVPGFTADAANFDRIAKVAGDQLRRLDADEKVRLTEVEKIRKSMEDWQKEKDKEFNKWLKAEDAKLKEAGKDYAKNLKTQNKAQITKLQKDDIASIAATGKPVEVLTRDMVVDVLGEEAAQQWEAQRVNAMVLFGAKERIGRTPSAGMPGVLRSMAPTPGTPGFSDAQKTYEQIDEEAKRVMKLREDDPAAAVAGDPAVVQAEQAVRFNQNDPQAWRTLAAARIKAQRVIGIPEGSAAPITREEALRFMAPVLEAVPGQEVKALRSVSQQFDQMFGEHAANAFMVGIASAGMDRQTSEIAGSLLRKLGMGKPVTDGDARALDDAKDNQAHQAAILPLISDVMGDVGIAAGPVQAAMGRMRLPPPMGVTGTSGIGGGPSAGAGGGGLMPTPLPGLGGPLMNDPLDYRRPPPPPSDGFPDKQTLRITDNDRQLLLSEPTPKRMMQFDQVYGRGAAKRILDATGNPGKAK